MLTAKTVKDRFRSTKKTNHTLNEYLVRFKQLIRWAYKNDMIGSTDFIDKMDRFKDEPRKALISDKYLESREVKILLENMENERYRDLTEFLVLTGLRIGEALALNIDDVDTKERVIHVTKTWDTNNFVLTNPKTQSSVRDIYMQDELFTLCKRLKKEALEKKLCSGFDAFFQNKSRRYTLGNYTAHLKNDSAQYLNHPITPHALRHTHVSLLAEQGVSFDIISRRLGHDGSQVTKDIYFHVTEGLKKKDSEQLKSIKIL
jgi:integrase